MTKGNNSCTVNVKTLKIELDKYFKIHDIVFKFKSHDQRNKVDINNYSLMYRFQEWALFNNTLKCHITLQGDNSSERFNHVLLLRKN